MRVGISGLAVSNAGGLGRLARTYILALASARPDWQLHVYLRGPEDAQRLAAECDGQCHGLLDSLHLHTPARRANRMLLEELSLPARFARLNLDAYLGLDFTLPRRRLAPREAVVVPDLLPFTRPRTVSPRARWLYRRGLRRAVGRGARLLCISEHTRTTLLRLFPDANDRASVILPALSPRLAQQAEAAAMHDHQLQVYGTHGVLSAPSHFLLYTGDSGPRKNVGLLVDVYRSMVEQGDYSGSLVLAGGDGRHGTASRQPTLALEAVGMAAPAGREGPQVYDLGYVSDADLSQLYASADLLVNLSKEEGFGYPVLEALAHGTPAVVTRGSAMEEVAPAGIVPTELDAEGVGRTLRSALTALPVLRQELSALPRGWFKIDRLGEELARALEI